MLDRLICSRFINDFFEDNFQLKQFYALTGTHFKTFPIVKNAIGLSKTSPFTFTESFALKKNRLIQQILLDYEYFIQFLANFYGRTHRKILQEKVEKFFDLTF